MTILNKIDPETGKIIASEKKRQQDILQLIPSENYTSNAVLEALGSELTNKYSEGYPKKRYYQGNKNIDEVEILAQDRAKKLFKVPYANVQPYSGSPANTAVYLALLEPLKDKIMGLSLAFGGHLTHGSPVSISGKYFKSVPYELGKNGQLDFDDIYKIAKVEKPKIIVCGFTAYPRIVDFEKFGKIANSVRAYLLADISHIAGLVAANAHPSPINHAHIVMTTTHKTLRGPRGAILMVTEKGIKKDNELVSKIDKAVFPGLQGGPHDNQTAAIAVALKEASTPAFKKYSAQIIKNSKALAGSLIDFDFDLSSGGSDNHLILIDLRKQNLNGALVAFALEVAGIVTNKNSIPFDPLPPFYPSGIRLGTPSVTTRGMKEGEMKKIAKWIKDVVETVKNEKLPEKRENRSPFLKTFKQKYSKNKKLLQIAREIQLFTTQFPIN